MVRRSCGSRPLRASLRSPLVSFFVVGVLAAGGVMAARLERLRACSPPPRWIPSPATIGCRVVSARERAEVGNLKPCPRRRSHIPGVRVNRGQPFNIGFATGHGGYIWATLIHADDISPARQRRSYPVLFEAPPEAKMRYRGKFWEKYHMAVGRYREAQYYSSRGMTHVASVDGVLDSDVPDLRIAGADDYWEHRRTVSRPAGPAMGLWRIPADGADADRLGLSLKDGDCREHEPAHAVDPSGVYVYGRCTLLRTIYARVEFPRHLVRNGNHILQWSWRGYRDCIDVEVLPDSKPLLNTSR